MSGRQFKNGVCTQVKDGRCALYPKERLRRTLGILHCDKCLPRVQEAKKASAKPSSSR